MKNSTLIILALLAAGVYLYLRSRGGSVFGGGSLTDTADLHPTIMPSVSKTANNPSPTPAGNTPASAVQNAVAAVRNPKCALFDNFFFKRSAAPSSYNCGW